MASSLQKSNKKKLILGIMAGAFVIALAFLVFNKDGLIKYLYVQSELQEMKTELDSLRNNNELLKKEIDSLERKIPAKIETTAREEYGMKRPNETPVKIEGLQDEGK